MYLLNSKEGIKSEYKRARFEFDKLYKTTKRDYNCAKMLEIENACENSPLIIWDKIKE